MITFDKLKPPVKVLKSRDSLEIQDIMYIKQIQRKIKKMIINIQDLKLEEHILIVLFKIWSTTKRYYKFNIIKVFNINILKTTAVCSIVPDFLGKKHLHNRQLLLWLVSRLDIVTDL